MESALKLRPSHILVLLARKEDELERTKHPLQLRLELLILRAKYNANLATVYEQRNDSINKTLAQIRSPRGNVAIDAVVRPAGASKVDRLTTDTELLKTADNEARQAVFAYLDGPQ